MTAQYHHAQRTISAGLKSAWMAPVLSVMTQRSIYVHQGNAVGVQVLHAYVEVIMIVKEAGVVILAVIIPTLAITTVDTDGMVLTTVITDSIVIQTNKT